MLNIEEKQISKHAARRKNKKAKGVVVSSYPENDEQDNANNLEAT